MHSNSHDITVSHNSFTLGTSPGAGNLFTLVPPVNLIYTINSLCFVFTADANAADRFITLQYRIVGSDILWFMQVPFAITAGTTFHLSFGINVPFSGLTATNGYFSMGLPDHFRLIDTMDIHIDVEGIQVGDTITNIAYQFDQWIDTGGLD